MSFATTYNAFQISGITKAEQHVLTAICTFADKNGVCWPTTETIAARCLSSVRTVQTHIHALVSKGLLQRIYRKGKPALTKVLIGQAATPATFSPRPPQFLHPEPVIEPVNTKTALPEPATPLPDTADAAIVVVEKIPELPVIPDVEVYFGPLEPSQRTPSPEVVQAPVALPVAPVPETTAQKPAEPVETIAVDPLADVPATLLEDLGEVRKSKKKPAKVTKTEANLWFSEAQKAGWTMQQVIVTMIVRGWSRFEADWVQHVPQQTHQSGPQAVWKPEPVQPASPGAIARFKETWARQRAAMVADIARKQGERMARRR